MTEPARNPGYDGRIVFMPEVAKLRAGDILLTRNAEGGEVKGLALSQTIRAFSGGTFDHALICSIPPTFVEAIETGVATLSLARCFTHSVENVRVLRYPDPVVAARAAQHAQVNVGRTYSKRKAVASVFPEAMIDEIKHRGIFCSALVAQAFKDAGAGEFAASKVSKTTPATLEKMEGLLDVTHHVFRAKLSPPNIEQMAALDGVRSETPSARQTEITMRYAALLFPSADGLAEQFPEANLSPPISFYDALQFAVRAMDARETIDEARRAEYDAAVAALDDMTATLAGSGELKALHEDIERIDAVSMQRNIAASFLTDPGYDVASLRDLAETTVGQIAQRETSDAELIEWSRGRSKAIGAWIEVHAPVIRNYKFNLAAFNEILGRLQPTLPPVV